MRPLVMGVLNVTPDSFYDGGLFFDHDAAIARGMAIISEGADIVDVGGESSRPGASPVPEDEELRRVLPVIESLSEHVRVSIDTRHQRVAKASVEAGASIVNDITASLDGVAAELGVGWVAMHMQGDPQTMQRGPRYTDVVTEVRDFLVARAERARRNGVREVWIDPGIGFGKTVEHNLSLVRHLGELTKTGLPVLVGVSRKSFLGGVIGNGAQVPAPPAERFEASLAVAVWAMSEGASMVRVHDVAPTVQAARIVGEATCAKSSGEAVSTVKHGSPKDPRRNIS